MAVLIDTNILLRSLQPSHPMQPIALRAIETLLARGERLCIAIQNVAEFWNCATRPIENIGLAFTIRRAKQEIESLEYFFEIVESDASYQAWKTLLIAYRVSGAQVHDARLAAVMKTSGIPRIVRFNVRDFTRYTHVEAIHPQDIA